VEDGAFSKTLRADIRIDWIHTPGSDLFLVLDTGYLTQAPLDPRESRWLRRTGGGPIAASHPVQIRPSEVVTDEQEWLSG
jgi:hypothetical protein